MSLAFEPNFRKILYTEYKLKGDFHNFLAARTFESFNLRILKLIGDNSDLKYAELGYFWSSKIVLNYIIHELPQNIESRYK